MQKVAATLSAASAVVPFDLQSVRQQFFETIQVNNIIFLSKSIMNGMVRAQSSLIKRVLITQSRISSAMMSNGADGSGAGKGGGGGGSIRSAGGSMGKREAAQEEQYFRKQQQEQLAKLKEHLQGEVKSHESLIKQHEDTIRKTKEKIEELKKLDK